MNCRKRGMPAMSKAEMKKAMAKGGMGPSEHDGRANMNANESERGPIADNKSARKVMWK